MYLTRPYNHRTIKLALNGKETTNRVDSEKNQARNERRKRHGGVMS